MLRLARLILVLAGTCVALLATSLTLSTQSDAQFDTPPLVPTRAVYAEDTDPAFVAQDMAARLGPALRTAHEYDRHWNPTFTALNNGGGSQGDALELTWSIVPDGTFMQSSGDGDTSCNSNLIATFDGIFGAGNWQAEFQRVWDDWSATTGNVYTPAVPLDADGTPVDDGANWPFAGGVENVRGDVRIGGCNIDGNGRVLAYNYFPSNGDMKIDATDSWYAGTTLSPGLHNLVSHEHGHGAGLEHVCPVDQTKLMEPFISTAYLGLQHDDIRGIQRGYGDRFEVINNDNDAMARASSLSFVLTQAGSDQATESMLSIDNTADSDWFSFTATAGELLDVEVAPVGFPYVVGADISPPLATSCSTTTASLLDSSAIQDLSFELRRGASLLASVDVAGAGSAESLIDYSIPADDTYFLRIDGTGTDDTQLYDLVLTKSEGTTIGNRVWNDLDGNGRAGAGEPGVADVEVRILDDLGSITQTTTTSPTGYWTADVDSSADWTIEIVPPTGFGFTLQDVGANDNNDSDADAAGRIEVAASALTGGVDNKSFDAGLVAGGGTTTIGNRVWLDQNANGRAGGSEPGVADVTIEILDGDDLVAQTATTGPTGYWTADVDPTLPWTIRVVPPTGFAFTLQDVGANDNLDSDADAAGLIPLPVGSLTAGVDDKSLDAGLADAVAPATIGNRVWQDLDGNGRAGGSEPGVANVEVRILDSGGALVETKTTGPTGYWTAQVDADLDWTIEIVAPAGFAFTLQDVGTNDERDSDADASGQIAVPASILTSGGSNKSLDAGLITAQG